MATTHTIHADDQTLKTELDVFIPEIWADSIKASFNKSLVFGSLTKDYSPLVSGRGDKINIPTMQDVAVAQEKVQGAPVDFATNTEVAMSITVDQHYATAVMIDDLAKIQSASELVSGYAESMAYQLALHLDTAVATKLATNINGFNLDNSDSSVDREITKKRLAALLSYMYKVKLNPSECTLVLSHKLYSSLFALDDFVHLSKIGNVNLPSGSVGQLMGMNVVPSNAGCITVPALCVDETAVADTLADDLVAGGYVVHNSALGVAYSKTPTPVAEYDMQYIAHKMVTDMIYGCNLLQDTNQVRAISLCETAQASAGAWD
jgi:hypothetical protein